MNDSSCVFKVINAALHGGGSGLSVAQMCEIAGVSRSGYYAWLKAADTRAAREEQDRKDFDLILKAYGQRGYAKGAKGIYMCLLHMEPPVVMNLKKIRRLMDKYGLSCPIRMANPYRRMARALRTSNVAGNLLQREFEEYGPRVVLLTDITYMPCNGTFAYLSTIMDAFTKQVLAYRLKRLPPGGLRAGYRGAAGGGARRVADGRDHPAFGPGLPLHQLPVHRDSAEQGAPPVHVSQGQNCQYIVIQ